MQMYGNAGRTQSVLTSATYRGFTYEIHTDYCSNGDIYEPTYSCNCCAPLHSVEAVESFIDELLINP